MWHPRTAAGTENVLRNLHFGYSMKILLDGLTDHPILVCRRQTVPRRILGQMPQRYAVGEITKLIGTEAVCVL